jgi:hypothetical protein
MKVISASLLIFTLHLNMWILPAPGNNPAEVKTAITLSPRITDNFLLPLGSRSLDACSDGCIQMYNKCLDGACAAASGRATPNACQDPVYPDNYKKAADACSKNQNACLSRCQK